MISITTFTYSMSAVLAEHPELDYDDAVELQLLLEGLAETSGPEGSG